MSKPKTPKLPTMPRIQIPPLVPPGWRGGRILARVLAALRPRPVEVYVVVDPVSTSGAFFTDGGRADDYARNTGGVLVELPVLADHRRRR